MALFFDSALILHFGDNMRRSILPLLILAYSTISFSQTYNWQISPQKINIPIGVSQRLQLLDDNAQELRGAEWTVDNPELAVISEDAGYAVLHPKKVGIVRVTAVLNGTMRDEEITIHSALGLPVGTTKWSTAPIGREIHDLPAAPGDGPHIYSLEQNVTGTYLRAFAEDGIQLWRWTLPETGTDVDLVCGDWLGGALISANHKDSFTLYTVGKDGTTQWHQTVPGIRKGHAYTLNHLVHILAKLRDNTSAFLYGFDEVTGTQKYRLALPASSGTTRVLLSAGSYRCSTAPATRALPIETSQLFVNYDGYAYLAFSNRQSTLGSQKCTLGKALAREDVSWKKSNKVLLWQIRPDGTVRSNVIEEFRSTGNEFTTIPVPTGEIMPDGENGLLLAMRWLSHPQEESYRDEEYVYRISPGAEVLYKLSLTGDGGMSHDAMVLGNDGTGFATRGGKLIAFDAQLGRELWTWVSNFPEIQVKYATANGGCIVQTPEGLALVENGELKKKVIGGTAFVDWEGGLFKTHQKPFDRDTNK